MEEREIISQMRSAKRKSSAIARRLKRHHSTICRELARNCRGGSYSAVRAQRWSERRRRERPLVAKLDRPKLREEVCRGLKNYWSPDQISGRLRRDHPAVRSCHVSHQTIYQWIRREPDRAHWESFLRYGGKRRRRRDRRGKIPRTVEIDRRPAVVNQRSRYGDWEGDTVIGARRQSALVTHVERKSGYLLAAKLEARQSAEVNRASKQLFASIPAQLRRTLTLDNGKEFASHEQLSQWIGMSVYFARPYAAWQRGTNENTNGLLRQFCPKGTDFRPLTDYELHRIVQLLNDRPRKRLRYRTPNEVFHNTPHLSVAFEN
jgi:IS30 family transposase